MAIDRTQFFNFIKTPNDTESFTSKSTQHYLDFFDKYQASGKKTSWNWATFFLAPFVFIHRKMYGLGFLICLIHLVLSIVFFECYARLILDYSFTIMRYSNLMTSDHFINYVSYFCITILSALYGDYIYLRVAEKQIAKGVSHSGVINKIGSAFIGFAIYVLTSGVFLLFTILILFSMWSYK